MSLLAANSAPNTTVVTTAETVAVNIPAFPLTPPANGVAIIIRGIVSVTVGTTAASVSVKLRTGQNNTTTGQVDLTETEVGVAAATDSFPFEFEDVVFADANLGYSITVTQPAATANGTITQVEYSVDVAIP